MELHLELFETEYSGNICQKIDFFDNDNEKNNLLDITLKKDEINSITKKNIKFKDNICVFKNNDKSIKEIQTEKHIIFDDFIILIDIDYNTVNKPNFNISESIFTIEFTNLLDIELNFYKMKNNEHIEYRKPLHSTCDNLIFTKFEDRKQMYKKNVENFYKKKFTYFKFTDTHRFDLIKNENYYKINENENNVKINDNEMVEYNLLVRDKVPSIIIEKGAVCTIKKSNDNNTDLIKKLKYEFDLLVKDNKINENEFQTFMFLIISLYESYFDKKFSINDYLKHINEKGSYLNKIILKQYSKN